MKKILAILLAMLMVMTMGVAMADEEVETKKATSSDGDNVQFQKDVCG